MPTEKKVQAVAELKELAQNASIIVGAEYRGLSVKDMTNLRRSLREAGVEAHVVKNRLFQLAVQQAGIEAAAGLVEGPTLVIFGAGDIVAPSKAIADYARTARNTFAPRKVFMDGQLVDGKVVGELASLERLWRDNKPFRRIAQQEMHVVEFQSLEGRCNVWLQPAHIVGLSYMRIQDALTRGFRDRMHFVHFDHLTRNPAAALAEIYRFLGESAFAHDFERVEQVTFEDDLVHGIAGLHDIRPAVRPVAHRAKEVLGDLVEKFKGPYIWDPYLPQSR